MSDKVFHDITQKGSIPFKDQNNHLLPKLELKEFSAREIQAFAEDIEKTNLKNQQKTDTAQHEFFTQVKIAVMTRLGIPLVRIAQRLNIHRKTISKYAKKNQELFNKINQEFKSGTSIPDIAQKYDVPQPLVWSVVLHKKTDLIVFDPPYFKKMADHYMKGSISDFSRPQYLNFFKHLFCLMREHAKPSTRIAFLNADFRDFQGVSALDENPDNAILMLTYAKLLETCGWKITHLTDCPLSTQRLTGNMVNKMQVYVIFHFDRKWAAWARMFLKKDFSPTTTYSV